MMAQLGLTRCLAARRTTVLALRSISTRRTLCAKSSKGAEAETDAVTVEPLTNAKGEVVKTWGQGVELPAVTKKEAEKAYLEATDFATGMKPAVQEAVAARDDMLKDRFNYVSKNLNSSSQYIVAGGKGYVAPAAIGQGSFLIAGLCVLLGGIGTVVYIKTQWGVKSAMELGDRLREKGAARKEMLERSTSASLVRSVSKQAETSVKENVELVRRPSQQLGAHFNESFKGVVKEGRTGGAPAAARAER